MADRFDLEHQYHTLWADRRAGESAAMRASARDLPLPWHAFTVAELCPLCGKMGPHEDGERPASEGLS